MVIHSNQKTKQTKPKVINHYLNVLVSQRPGLKEEKLRYEMFLSVEPNRYLKF